MVACILPPWPCFPQSYVDCWLLLISVQPSAAEKGPAPILESTHLESTPPPPDHRAWPFVPKS